MIKKCVPYSCRHGQRQHQQSAQCFAGIWLLHQISSKPQQVSAHLNYTQSWILASVSYSNRRWYAIFGPVLFGSALKLFDTSLKIRGPVVVKRAEFIRNRKVRTRYLGFWLAEGGKLQLSPNLAKTTISTLKCIQNLHLSWAGRDSHYVLLLAEVPLSDGTCQGHEGISQTRSHMDRKYRCPLKKKKM